MGKVVAPVVDETVVIVVIGRPLYFVFLHHAVVAVAIVAAVVHSTAVAGVVRNIHWDKDRSRIQR